MTAPTVVTSLADVIVPRKPAQLDLSLELPSKPALRFHGGKWRLAPWILSHFPEHRVYVEPYGGSFAVGMQKPPVALDVWNDSNQYVRTFFLVLREREDELLAAIRATPYHRAEALEAERRLRSGETGDALETARLLYVQSWQTFGGVRDARTSSGYRVDVSPKGTRTNVGVWQAVEHLHQHAARLRSVQFEDGDALDVIDRYGANAEALLYVDPPYVSETRERRWRSDAYAVETDSIGQIRLAERLAYCSAAVVLSGYWSPLYDDLYAGWQRVETESRTTGRSSRTECLWIAPAPKERAALWRLGRYAR